MESSSEVHGPQPDTEVWPPLSPQAVVDRRKAKAKNQWLMVKFAVGTGIIPIALIQAMPNVFVIWLLLLPGLLKGVHDRGRVTTATDDTWLVEQPDKDEFMVEMLVEVDGVVRGRERGIAWFTEGAIHFTGDRTWLCLVAQNVVPAGERSPLVRWSDELTRGYGTLRLKKSHPRIRIKFECDPRYGDIKRDAFNFFLAQLTNAEAPDETEEHLPITVFDPYYRHDVWRDTEIATPRLFALLLLPLLILLPESWIPTGGLVAVPLVIVYIAAVPATRILRPATIRYVQRRRILRSSPSINP